jgi:hypothetical protein
MLAEDAFDIVNERYCASDCARIAGTETPSCTTRVSPSNVMFRELRKTLGSGEAEAEEPCMRRSPTMEALERCQTMCAVWRGAAE